MVFMKHVSRSNRPNRRGLRPLSSIAPVIALGLLASSTVPAWADANIPSAAAPRGDSAVLSSVAQWRMLQQSDSYSFASYASFMMAHPGWPGEANMRRVAERAVRPEADPPSLIASYFRRNAPTTAVGHLRFAEALLAQGQRDEARMAARRAWTVGSLSTADEASLLSRFADAIQPADHDLRMDRLLWQRATSAAARQLPYTGAVKRAIFEARLAFLTKAPDASARALAVEAIGRNDAGYLADKAFWQNATMQMANARAMLAAPRTLSAPPSDPAKWLEVLLVNARGAANDQQWSLGYNIARQATDAYAPGTVVRDRPFEERDDYTSLLWLAASTSLNKLARPAEAVPIFPAFAHAGRSAHTQTKGL